MTVFVSPDVALLVGFLGGIGAVVVTVGFWKIITAISVARQQRRMLRAVEERLAQARRTNRVNTLLRR